MNICEQALQKQVVCAQYSCLGKDGVCDVYTESVRG